VQAGDEEEEEGEARCVLVDGQVPPAPAHRALRASECLEYLLVRAALHRIHPQTRLLYASAAPRAPHRPYNPRTWPARTCPRGGMRAGAVVARRAALAHASITPHTPVSRQYHASIATHWCYHLLSRAWLHTEERRCRLQAISIYRLQCIQATGCIY
jgi:hypothetical protein